jgi:hypothetical protein
MLYPGSGVLKFIVGSSLKMTASYPIPVPECSSVHRSSPGPSWRLQPEATVGFAAGGRISQKIIRDHLPPAAYDKDNSARLHISVLNTAYFTAVTGRPSPPSPISTSTYQKLGLPWYTLFDENIPGVSRLPGFHVQSIADVDISRNIDGQNSATQTACGYCTYEMATTWLLPCAHVVCDDCAAGLSESCCVSCDNVVERRERFAAPMPLPGKEDEVEIKPDVTVALKRYSGRRKVVTYKLDANKVSPLRGENSEQGPSWRIQH